MDYAGESLRTHLQAFHHLLAASKRSWASGDGEHKRFRLLCQRRPGQHRMPMRLGSLLFRRVVDESDEPIGFPQAIQRFDGVAIARKNQERSGVNVRHARAFQRFADAFNFPPAWTDDSAASSFTARLTVSDCSAVSSGNIGNERTSAAASSEWGNWPAL